MLIFSQVYGLFDMAVRQDRYSNTTSGAANLTKWHMHNGAPNRLGFRGTEALGGGMSAAIPNRPLRVGLMVPANNVTFATWFLFH